MKSIPSHATSMSTTPRFGCRVFTYMGEQGSDPTQQKTLLQGLLQTGENAFVTQSQKRSESPRNGQDNSFNNEDLIGHAQRGNEAGWGLEAYNNDGDVFCKRSLKAAHSDPDYAETVNTITNNRPNTILGHLRFNPGKEEMTLAKLHPFQHQNWSAMHNGFMIGAQSKPIQEKLQKYTELLGEGPKSKVASEVLLYLFLGKLKERFSTIDSKQIPLDELKKTFLEIVDEINDLSPKESSPIKNPKFNWLSGETKFRPASNVVLTDGNIILAYRKGRDLNIARTVDNNGKQGFILASERMQPDTNTRTLDWIEIPEDEILALQKQPLSGEIKASLQPAYELRSSKPESN